MDMSLFLQAQMYHLRITLLVMQLRCCCSNTSTKGGSGASLQKQKSEAGM